VCSIAPCARFSIILLYAHSPLGFQLLSAHTGLCYESRSVGNPAKLGFLRKQERREEAGNGRRERNDTYLLRWVGKDPSDHWACAPAGTWYNGGTLTATKEE